MYQLIQFSSFNILSEPDLLMLNSEKLTSLGLSFIDDFDGISEVTYFIFLLGYSYLLMIVIHLPYYLTSCVKHLTDLK